RHESFLPLFYAGVVPGTEDERLVLAAGSSLGGRIVDPEGDPVEGAKVRIRLGREREVHRLFLADGRFPSDAELAAGDGREVITDASGGFLFRGIGLGPWILDATSEAYAPVTRRTDAMEGERIDLGDIPLSPAGRIEGRVVDESGAGIASARVVAERAFLATRPSNRIAGPPPGDVSGEATPDPRGAFVLERVPETALTLRVETEGRVRVSRENVRPGAEDIEIVLPPGLSISGRIVRDADGK